MVLTNVSYDKNIFDEYINQTFSFDDKQIFAKLGILLHETTSRMKYELKHNISSDETMQKLKDIRNDFLAIAQDFIIKDFAKRNWFNNPEDRISVQACYTDQNYIHIRFYYEGPAEEELLKEDIIFENEDEFHQYESSSYHDAFANAFHELFKPNDHYADASKIFVHTFTFQTSEDCNLSCFPEGIKILMGDFTEKNIEDIKIGDEVLSFEERPDNINKIKYKKDTVTKTFINETDELLKIEFTFDKYILVTPNHPFLTSDNEWKLAKDLTTDDILLMKTFNYYTELLFIKNIETIKVDKIKVYNLEVLDNHTYIANNILVHNCKYCYQMCKTAGRMNFETAKKCIDDMLNDKYDYINRYNAPAIIIEFIGGEPLLEITLTRKIYEYFLDTAYKMNHPWFDHHRVSICSNGLLYFEEEVQEFFKDYHERISFNISIDGNKDLHDAARVQPNHEGSYDMDMLAYSHYIETYKDYNPGSKMTLAPSNIKYLFESLVNFVNQGFKVIHLNCVFEEGWNLKHAKIYYDQLKKVADYVLDNNLEKINIALFSRFGSDNRLSHSSDTNFCGGTSSMLALDYKGLYYPCIRYMPSSLDDDRIPLVIGDLENGIEVNEEHRKILDGMHKTTRRSQSNDICFDCPINQGCAWCSGNNYNVYGTWNKRTTFHCDMHIVEILANVYYWNLFNIKHPEYERGYYKNNVPDEWALRIISKEELEFLKALEIRSEMIDKEKLFES